MAPPSPESPAPAPDPTAPAPELTPDPTVPAPELALDPTTSAPDASGTEAETSTIDKVLGPSGVLAACIPHYEDRPAQRRMAHAVDEVLRDDGVLLVEAGTGTGKTLGYLVPALLGDRRVVASTGTRTLQDQITRRDLPLLEEVLDRRFTAVTLKGVSNYVCVRKLGDARTLAALTDETRADFETISEWAKDTVTGDRAEVDSVADDAPIWSLLTNTPHTRIGPRCPHYEQCFVTRARRRAEKADLVIVNHHLLFADLALRTSYPGAKVLPEYDAVVFDEAHQLEDVMTEHFGIQVSTVRVAQLARDARTAFAGPSGPLFGHAGGNTTAERIIAHVERCAEALFHSIRPALARASAATNPANAAAASSGGPGGGPGDGAGRVAIDPSLFADDDRQELWFRLDAALDELAAHAALAGEALAAAAREAAEHGGSGPGGRAEDDQAEAVQAAGRRAETMRAHLAAIAEQSERAFVYWAEARPGSVALCASPVEVASYMRQHVLGQVSAAVLTSATLRADNSFAYTRRRLGLDGDLAAELVAPSPFDYRRQALLYLPRDLPDPRAPGFSAAACARVIELCAITSGRAFVLFTSHRALRAAARHLAGRLPYPLLIQGEMPRAALIERFRARPGAVLLGTGTFWEGVDVPGDALSLVIIDKLPFAPHTDPLVSARMERIADTHGDPFEDYQLPQAALALEQGFGRLIRRSDDRGIVAVLDPRIVTRRYGRVFVTSLPEGLPRTSSLERVRRWWRGDDPGVDVGEPAPDTDPALTP
ncbi:ATP-dependent DNA helicase [Haliangium sp.]|uniref:ATP-dependent DNA helicase n=1 Tax=Haliangium sp. TaxID=2663208 RepID=UPI003D0C13C0